VSGTRGRNVEILGRAGWDSGETAGDDNDNESDDSGGEFEVRISTDSSDDDVQELRTKEDPERFSLNTALRISRTSYDDSVNSRELSWQVCTGWVSAAVFRFHQISLTETVSDICDRSTTSFSRDQFTQRRTTIIDLRAETNLTFDVSTGVRNFDM
jgi:hypothetical protein